MTYHLRIKICGVTTPDDAHGAAHLGADAIGLNFYPPSPRFLTVSAARQILDVLPAFVEPVGVFVQESLSSITERLRELPRIRTVQWHGQLGEPEDASPYRLLPAFAVRNADTLDEIRRYVKRSRVLGRLPPAVLVDAHVPGMHGGTGQTAPWELLASFEIGVPLILAGGLTPDNVAEAVRRVRPYAVDVASGVESSPGRKDVKKMRCFLENARAAASALEDG